MFVPFNDWFETNPTAGFFCFAALYMVIVPLTIPSTIMTLAGGVIFSNAYGKLKGYFICALAIWIGHPPAAITAYFLGKYCLRDFIRKNVIKQLRVFEAIDKSIAVEGPKLMILLRI